MTPIPIPCPRCGSVLKIRDPQMIGKKAKCPKCAQIFRLEMLASVAAAATQHQEAGSSELPMSGGPAAVETALPNFLADGAPAGATGRLQAQRKKDRKRMLVSACISAAVLLAAGLVSFYAIGQFPEKPRLDLAVEDEGDFEADAADASPIGDFASAMTARVEPIDLKYIPAGTRIVIHLHPADLWKPDSREEEFRFCLGPISEFLAAKIQELSKREPAQVADALFCLIPNERGTAPDLAAVFHLRSEAKKSQLLDDFGGRRVESPEGIPYYVANERAYLFPDLKTIVSCPVKLVEDMVAASHSAQPTSEGIDELLLLTDRSRPITVLFEPVATRIDAEFLMPPGAIPLLEQFVEFLGPETETVGWSLKLDRERVRSEVLMRNKGGLQSQIVERDLQRGLDKLAGQVLQAVEQMAPKELGKRKIIGRVPAMTRAFALATRTEPGPRFVKLVTQLPERAAPNLALGVLLAWDESTRTAFSGTGGKTPAGDSEKPDNTPIADKLKRKITVEFKREPLQQAFAYIANEIKAKLEIDGDALKLSAYTKNMPQTFALENAPAIDVIQKILKQPMYEKMCLVVDEKQNSLQITTYPVAEQKGLKPYAFPE